MQHGDKRKDDRIQNTTLKRQYFDKTVAYSLNRIEFDWISDGKLQGKLTDDKPKLLRTHILTENLS